MTLQEFNEKVEQTLKFADYMAKGDECDDYD